MFIIIEIVNIQSNPAVIWIIEPKLQDFIVEALVTQGTLSSRRGGVRE